MESSKLEYKLYNKSVVVCTNEWKQPKCHCDNYVASFPLDQYQAWLNAAHFGLDMARVDTSFAHLSRAFREPFARNLKKISIDTLSYLVFRGSSANLSPTCTFLERYLSRRHLKSMPVDLDYIKPFMGFCTTLMYPAPFLVTPSKSLVHPRTAHIFRHLGDLWHNGLYWAERCTLL